MRTLLLAWAVVTISACGDRPAGDSTGAATRGPSAPSFDPPPGAPLPPTVFDAPSARPSARPQFASGSTPRPLPPSVPSQPLAEPVPAARATSGDPLPAAVERAFGSPVACLGDESRDRIRDRLRIELQVTVTSSGRVTRAYVRANDLPPAEVACMQQRAERMSLGITVPDAPRTITTAIEYTVRSDRTQTALREPEPIERPASEVAADRTLEAAGTVSERPPGFVAPSRTLPAIAP